MEVDELAKRVSTGDASQRQASMDFPTAGNLRKRIPATPGPLKRGPRCFAPEAEWRRGESKTTGRSEKAQVHWKKLGTVIAA